MLSKISAEVGVNVSEILVDNEITLVPLQGSLLNEIVNANKNSSLVSQVLSPSTSKTYFTEMITTAARGRDIVVKGEKKYEHSSHDTFMENYIRDLSTLVSNHVLFSRSVVNKEVTIFKDKVVEALDGYKFKQAESLFDITYFKLHSVFETSWLTEELSSYKGSTKQQFFKPLDFSNLLRSTENIEEFISNYVLIGSQDEDKLISEWVNTTGSMNCVNNIMNKVNEYQLSSCELIHHSFVNWLFYRNLTIKSDLDIGISSSELISIAAGNRDYFAVKLLVALDVYEKEVRRGIISCSNFSELFSVFVDKPISLCLYEDSMEKLGEKGLNIDVLLGYLNTINPNRYVTVDELAANAEEYLNKWKNARALFTIKNNNDRLAIFKQIARTVFEERLNNIENEEEKEYLTSNSNHLNVVREEGNKYIDDLRNDEIDDIDTIALELIARIRYSYSCGYVILKEMSRLLAQDDKLTPLEAATYSVINYVTDFLFDQVNIVRR